MVKNKNNQTIWNTRIKNNSSNLSQKIGSSIDVDKRLYKEDINGSIAHVEMLFKQKIISFRTKNKIIYGLNKIEKEISLDYINLDFQLTNLEMAFHLYMEHTKLPKNSIKPDFLYNHLSLILYF